MSKTTGRLLDIFLKREKFKKKKKKRIRNSTKIMENDLKSVNNRKNMKFKRKEIRKIELKKNS